MAVNNTTDNKAARAGRYLRQPAGYRAFIPAPLPPEPPLYLGGALRDKLSAADYALGRLDGAVLTLPNPDLFVFMYVRKEAVLSSQIEGTQSSLQNLLAAEAQLFDPDTPKDVNEVANYVRAMNHGLSRLADLPVSVRLIREIHAQLMQGVRGGRLQPGELRTSQNWIGPAGCTLANASFVPPPPHEVSQALSDLERFLHDGGGLPPLVQVGLAHAQFETIHPFLDGNGRVGRLLIALILHHDGVLRQPLLYLSLYFKQHRAEYYRLLDAVRQTGDWEAWLDFFLEGVQQTAAGAVDTAHRLLALFKQDADRIQTLGRAAANTLRVFDALRRQPLANIDALAQRTGLSFPTVARAIDAMQRLGVVQEITGKKRERVFAYQAYLDILNEGGAP